MRNLVREYDMLRERVRAVENENRIESTPPSRWELRRLSLPKLPDPLVSSSDLSDLPTAPADHRLSQINEIIPRIPKSLFVDFETTFIQLGIFSAEEEVYGTYVDRGLRDLIHMLVSDVYQIRFGSRRTIWAPEPWRNQSPEFLYLWQSGNHFVDRTLEIVSTVDENLQMSGLGDAIGSAIAAIQGDPMLPPPGTMDAMLTSSQLLKPVFDSRVFSADESDAYETKKSVVAKVLRYVGRLFGRGR